MHRVDVVIVGGGPAGLSALPPVAAAGRKVVLLEARHRVGGRLCGSSHDGTAGFDVGASWFWSNERRMRSAVATLGLGSFPQPGAKAVALVQDRTGRVQRLAGNPMGTGGNRLVGGMPALAAALRQQCDSDSIHLGQPVCSILPDPQSSNLVVRTSNNECSWVAPAVILAVPPALAVATIDFGTGLEPVVDRVARSTPVWFGGMVKVVAHFQAPFWRTSGLAGDARSQCGPLSQVFDLSGESGEPAALFGFCQPLPGKPAPTSAAITAQLVTLFGKEAEAPLKIVVQDWRREPFTSPKGVERLSDYSTFGHAVWQSPALGGRLHWASTETAEECPGHVEGALAAAERAVAAVLRQGGLRDHR